jgi:hypothetical protein
MSTKKQAYKMSALPGPVRRAVQRYAEARVVASWKGGGDPEDWPDIEWQLR